MDQPGLVTSHVVITWWLEYALNNLQDGNIFQLPSWWLNPSRSQQLPLYIPMPSLELYHDNLSCALREMFTRSHTMRMKSDGHNHDRSSKPTRVISTVCWETGIQPFWGALLMDKAVSAIHIELIRAAC